MRSPRVAYSVLARAAGTDRVRAVGATVLFLSYELLTPATLIWYGSGLENLQLTLGIVALLARFQRWWSEGPSPWLDGLLALAVALVRPESFLYPLALLVVVLAIRLSLGREGTPRGLTGCWARRLALPWWAACSFSDCVTPISGI